MSLRHLFPRPRPVQLAGEVYLASELRLRDLADLDAVAAALAGDAVAALDAFGGKDTPEYRAALKTAYDQTRGGGIGLDDATGRALAFGTLAGRVALLMACLRDHQPAVAVEAATALVAGATAAEWSVLEKLAFAAAEDRWPDVVQLIDAAAGVPPFEPAPHEDTSETTWDEAICEFLAEHPAYTLDAAGDLTIGQWRSLRTGGKQGERGEPLPADEHLADEVQGKRAAFWAEGEGKAAPVPETPGDGAATDAV